MRGFLAIVLVLGILGLISDTYTIEYFNYDSDEPQSLTNVQQHSWDSRTGCLVYMIADTSLAKCGIHTISITD